MKDSKLLPTIVQFLNENSNFVLKIIFQKIKEEEEEGTDFVGGKYFDYLVELREILQEVLGEERKREIVLYLSEELRKLLAERMIDQDKLYLGVSV